VDEELVVFEFEVDDVSFLIFVDVLRKYIGTLSVGLTPLFGVCIEKGESENSFSKLIHYVDPK
jgi:hypothetical protein